jgi:hypothetical protein
VCDAYIFVFTLLCLSHFYISIFHDVMRKKCPTLSIGISTNVKFGATHDAAEDLDHF